MALSTRAVPAAEAAPPPYCPIELLHPAGRTYRTRIIGSACPPWLCRDGGSSDSLADVMVISPDAAERRDHAWLAKAASTVVHALAPEGVAYVAVGRGQARSFASLLRGAGLQVGPLLVHLPSGTADTYIVPAQGRLLRFTVSQLMIGSSHLGRAAGWALAVPGAGSLATRWLVSSAVVIRRPGGRPPFDWLSRDGERLAAPVIRTKWRAQGGSAVLYCFGASGLAPNRVVKVSLTDSLAWRTEGEAAALAALGPSAARAGARIPPATLLHTIPDRPALVLDHLEGRQAADLLIRRRIGPLTVAGLLSRWLEAWNRDTMTVRRVDETWLQAELFAGATRLAPLLRDGLGYLGRLREIAHGAVGQRLPLVAAHNDLTMRNVLLRPGAPPAVLDWEAARPDGLPLADFFYAAVDAVAAASPGHDRHGAFLSCFGWAGSSLTAIRPMAERIGHAVGLPGDVLIVCFHACWVQHAVNESAKRPGAGPRPFLRIIESLARGCVEIPGVRAQ